MQRYQQMMAMNMQQAQMQWYQQMQAAGNQPKKMKNPENGMLF